jgi:hypothetical protein
MNNLGDTDALAAEFVLGTLDFDEREQARALLSTDEAFAAKVKLWERRFGELHLMVEPVEPDPQLWERVKARLSQVEPDMEVKAAEPAAPEPVSMPESQVPSPTIVPAVAPETPAAGGGEGEPEQSPVAPEAAPLPPPLDVTALSPSPPPLPPEAVMPAPLEAVVPTPAERRAAPAERADAVIRRRLAGWRALALLLTLVVVAVAGLLAAWRFAPDRVPPGLQPIELMRLVGVTLPSPEPPPPRPPPAPPESQFDE